MKNTKYKMNYKLYTQLKFWIIWVKMQTCSYRWKEKNPSNWHRIPWNTDGWVEQNRWQCLFVWGFLWKSIEHSSVHKFLEHHICWQYCHCHYHSTIDRIKSIFNNNTSGTLRVSRNKTSLTSSACIRTG